MIGIGSAIGAGLQGLGSIFGGISASKAMKKVKKNLEGQRAQNLNWYNKRYNEDPTQRASAVALLTRLEDNIRNRNRQAAATQAVAGGTEESVAATKAANNEALANTMTNIVVNDEARKDAIESTYLQTDQSLNDKLNDMELNKANQITNAIQGVTDAGSKIADLF